MTNSEASAFPMGEQRGVQPEYGLTKREYFAGLALSGLLSKYVENGQYGNHLDFPLVGEIAVRVADDILFYLSKPETK